MSLFVTVMAMTMPLLSRTLGSLARKNGAEDILRLAAFARERAILEGTDYGIRFDTARKAYWLLRREDAGFETRLARVPERWGRRRSWPSELEGRTSEPTVLFHPNGSASPFSLDLIAPSGRTFTIHVDPVLGKASALERP